MSDRRGGKKCCKCLLELGSTSVMPYSPLPVYVCGATASGKTAYALDLAAKLQGEIVNCDAFQLYREIPVLSAAPSPTERGACPHHLFGVLEAGDSCDAGRFEQMARPVIADIQRRGKVPIVVGGSGLYLKFLTHGASPLPRGDAELREKMRDKPVAELLAELSRLDPEEAAQVDATNHRYVSRSLEICLLSGEKVSALRDRWAEKTRKIEGKLRGVWLQRPREDLHARIGKRTAMMLRDGAIDEVRALGQLEGNWQKAIGVKEIRRYLEGEISRERCEELIVFATRQYAKRQETWFRREGWLKVVHVGGGEG